MTRVADRQGNMRYSLGIACYLSVVEHGSPKSSQVKSRAPLIFKRGVSTNSTRSSSRLTMKSPMSKYVSYREEDCEEAATTAPVATPPALVRYDSSKRHDKALDQPQHGNAACTSSSTQHVSACPPLQPSSTRSSVPPSLHKLDSSQHLDKALLSR